MGLLLKMLKITDKTQMENLGFIFRKNRFCRLHGRSFQTLEFQASHICYDRFQLLIGISFLSKPLRHHEGGYTFYELTGKNYQLSRNNADELYFDRDSQENTNTMFANVFDQIEKRIVPLLNQITDESSFLVMGERNAGDGHSFFYTFTNDYFLYAICNRFDKAIEILSGMVERSIDTTEQNYQYFIEQGMFERAEEILQNQRYYMLESQIIMEALKKRDITFFKEGAEIYLNDNIDFLWKNYKLKVIE